MKKAFAVSLLGLYLIRHFILRIFTKIRGLFKPRQSDGLKRFEDNYGADRIRVLNARESAKMAEMQRCIRCGLCDSMCENSRALMQASARTPSLLASTYSRSLPEAHLAAPMAESFSACESCVACFDICPTEVPIRDIVALMQHMSGKASEKA